MRGGEQAASMAALRAANNAAQTKYTFILAVQLHFSDDNKTLPNHRYAVKDLFPKNSTFLIHATVKNLVTLFHSRSLPF
jgi:hypothetical protein